MFGALQAFVLAGKWEMSVKVVRWPRRSTRPTVPQETCWPGPKRRDGQQRLQSLITFYPLRALASSVGIL